MELTNEMIQLAINCTTFQSDGAPNAHRVMSWIQNFLDINCSDKGESFDMIARYLYRNYSIKTRLSDGVMQVPDSVYYMHTTEHYGLTYEELSVVLARNEYVSSNVREEILKAKQKHSNISKHPRGSGKHG